METIRQDDPVEEAVEMAWKLVGLAEEQLDALHRRATDQLKWLMVRREEITTSLATLLRQVYVPTDFVSEFSDAARRLAFLDAEMGTLVRERMSDIRAAQFKLHEMRVALNGPGAAPAY